MNAFAALHNTVLNLPSSVGIGLRCINLFLAVAVAILGAVSARHTPDRTQQARFLGVAVFFGTFAWATLFRLESEVTIQIPFFTLGLILSAYGAVGFLNRPPR